MWILICTSNLVAFSIRHPQTVRTFLNKNYFTRVILSNVGKISILELSLSF